MCRKRWHSCEGMRLVANDDGNSSNSIIITTDVCEALHIFPVSFQRGGLCMYSLSVVVTYEMGVAAVLSVLVFRIPSFGANC